MNEKFSVDDFIGPLDNLEHILEMLEEFYLDERFEDMDDAFELIENYKESVSILKRSAGMTLTDNEWLDGHEVKEEQVYYALVKGHELVTDEGDIACKYWNLRVPTGDVLPSNRYSRRGEFLVKMSKSEWNKLGINDSNADFVKVSE